MLIYQFVVVPTIDKTINKPRVIHAYGRVVKREWICFASSPSWARDEASSNLEPRLTSDLKLCDSVRRLYVSMALSRLLFPRQFWKRIVYRYHCWRLLRIFLFFFTHTWNLVAAQLCTRPFVGVNVPFASAFFFSYVNHSPHWSRCPLSFHPLR